MPVPVRGKEQLNYQTKSGITSSLQAYIGLKFCFTRKESFPFCDMITKVVHRRRYERNYNIFFFYTIMIP